MVEQHAVADPHRVAEEVPRLEVAHAIPARRSVGGDLQVSKCVAARLRLEQPVAHRPPLSPYPASTSEPRTTSDKAEIRDRADRISWSLVQGMVQGDWRHYIPRPRAFKP